MQATNGQTKQPAPVDDLPPAPTGPPNPDAIETMTAKFADYGVEFNGPPLPVLLSADADQQPDVR